jgi:ParB family chromosome partitioning protein
MTTYTYRDMPVDQIDRNPGQPRKQFDADKLRELSESIAANGLLEPIIVRPADGRYLIVAGERRWRASQQAGLTSVPVRIMDLDEVEAYVLSVAENVNRNDMTVMEEARSFAQLQAYGKSVEEISRVFGKRASTVRERLTLTTLEPHIADLIDTGVVGPALGYKLSWLQGGNRRQIAQRLARGEVDHQAACDLADATYEAEQQTGFFDVEEPTEEERLAHQRAARQARSLVDQIERLSALLGDLATADPADLAAALGADVGARLDSVDRIGRQVSSATRNLRKAKAIAEARTLVIADGVKG